MSEHEVSWESWQAVCKERDALRKALESILKPHPHRIDYTWDKGHIINGRVKKCMAIDIAKAALGEK